jgi:hypothetical protein
MKRLLLILLPVLSLAASPPPLPSLPPAHARAASVHKAQSPRAAEQATALGAPMFIAPPPISTLATNTIEAQFAPTQLTNLTAFIDATTNLSAAWQRQSLPYPTNGGWMKINFTNHGAIFARAGYIVP